MTTRLTLRQCAVLYFVAGFTADFGYAPTIAELAHGLNAASTTAIRYQLDELAKAGLLTRGKGAGRTIALVESEGVT